MLISWAIDAIIPILKRNEPLVLATVISKSGSAPSQATGVQHGRLAVRRGIAEQSSQQEEAPLSEIRYT